MRARDLTRSLSRGLRSNGLWRYYAGFAIGRLGGLFVLPVLSRILGPGEFGVFDASLAVVLGATLIVDAGLGTGLVRFIGTGQPTPKLLGAAASIQIAASMGAILVFAAPLLLVAGDSSSVPTLLGALACYVFVEGFAIIGAGLLRGEGRDGVYLGLSVVRLLVTAVAGVVGAELAGAGGALFGIGLGGLGFAAFAVAQLVRGRSFGNRELRGKLLRYGIPLSATSVMTWTLGLSDRLFLKASVSDVTLGLYSANYRLGGVIVLFLAAPLAQAWIGAVRVPRPRPELDALCIRWSHYFGVAALGSVVVLLAAAESGVPLVFGNEFTADRFVIAAVGVSGWLLGLYYLIATPILVGTTTVVLAVVSLVTVAVTLVLNAVLILPFGPHGAALATLLSALALCAVTGFASARRGSVAWLFRGDHLLPVLGLLAAVALAAVGTVPALLSILAVLCIGGGLALRTARGNWRQPT
jgi:O-antigen/teichoic acid export membrane protein